MLFDIAKKRREFPDVPEKALMDVKKELEDSYFVNPLSDWGFKRLFGEEFNKDILIEFLNVMFPEKNITSISYLRNEKNNLELLKRNVIFDIICESADKEKFIVEMQRCRQKYFIDRSLYYMSFPIMEQGVKGTWDFKLHPVYLLGVLDFELPHKADVPEGKVLFDYWFTESEIGKKIDKVGIKYLELPRFNKSEDELETLLDKWCYMFRNMKNLTKRPIELQEKVFQMIFKTASIESYDEKTKDKLINKMITEWDIQNYATTAREEGFDEGKEVGKLEGREEGRAEGREEERISMIKNFLECGADESMILSATGISKEQLEQIKAQ